MATNQNKSGGKGRGARKSRVSRQKVSSEFCHWCDRSFGTVQGRQDHIRDKHFGKESALAVLEGLDDLSDGAYFALAEELGLSAEDLATQKARK